MIYFLYLLILVSFVDLFAQLSMISPFLSEFGMSTVLTVFLMSVYIFNYMVGNLISGYFVDKKGVKLVAIVGLLVTGLIWLVYPLVTTTSQVLFVRVFHGLAGGLLIPVSFTYLSFIKTKLDQNKKMLLFGISLGLALMIGLFFGEIINQDLIFNLIGILMLWIAALVFFLFSHPAKKPVENVRARPSPLTVMRDLLKQPLLGYGYAGVLLLMFATSAFVYLLPLKIEGLGYDNSLVGVLFGTSILVSLFIFALPADRLYQRCSKLKTMAIGIIILSICFSLLSFVTLKPILFFVMTLFGVGFAWVFPTALSMVAEGANEKRRGMAYGLFFSFFSFGTVAGLFVTGLFLTVFISFLIGATALILSSILLWTSFSYNIELAHDK